MQAKTEGIVLNYLKYRDTSIIVRIYTRDYGLQSYIINGIRSQKSRKSIGLFQPFTILDPVAYHNPKKDINRLSEYKNQVPLNTVHYDISKSTIALFLTEVLIKTLSEHFEDDNPQFDFIKESIIKFDALETGYENFHLFFLINYAHFLGFGIYDMAAIDMRGDEELQYYLSAVSQEAIFAQVASSQKVRRKALEILIEYYSEHVDSLGKIKSLEVMYQIFAE